MSSSIPIRVAPSILGADFAHLADQIAVVERAGAELLHLDIMDGHFVPNLSFGIPVVEAVARSTDLFLDTHLMISDPARYAAPFVEAGAGGITFHIEAAERPRDVVNLIRELGAQVGVALNPGTPAEAIFEIIEEVDLVLVMTVWPGFGGQEFIADCLEKVDTIARHLSDEQWLEVDGGITAETARRAVAAGADTLVAGNAIFRAPDPVQALRDIQAAAVAAGEDTSEASA